jgi:hypothetical protein
MKARAEVEMVRVVALDGGGHDPEVLPDHEFQESRQIGGLDPRPRQGDEG